MAQSFGTKDPGETVVLTFDATLALVNGETLTTIVSTTVRMIYGMDPDPSAVVNSPQINAAPVTITQPNAKTITIATAKGVQAIATGGLTNCGYLIAIECETSNPDKVLVLKGVLPVSSN